MAGELDCPGGCDSGDGIIKEIIKQSESDKELARQIEALRATNMGGLYRGEWQVGTSYAVNETVSRGGVLYASTVGNNTSVPPSATWTLLLQSDYGYYTGE